jgi:phosphatidate cytidylyltransferase
MFMQRLFTTLVLVPIVLLALFYGPAWLLGAVLLLLSLLAGWECWQLIPLQSPSLKSAFIVILILTLVASAYVFQYWLIVGMCFWLLACIAIIYFPDSQRYWGYPGIVAASCIFTWSLFMQSLVHLYWLPQGKALILYLLCVVWAADIGAYLAGKQWGKHKMIPLVSPGKSWEGSAGGMALAMLVAWGGFAYFKPVSIAYWFVLALITVVISIFGDLFISILKRRCHLKDTGAIIPGHGGILDRLDSLNAAVPLFYFGLTHLSLGIAHHI